MRRRIVIVVVFLFAGVVVNVGVAWGCGAWLSLYLPSVPPMRSEIKGGVLWTVFVVNQQGLTVFVTSRGKRNPSLPDQVTDPTPNSLIPGWCNLDVPSRQFAAAERGALEVRTVIATGWPLRSLWAESQGVINTADALTVLLT